MRKTLFLLVLMILSSVPLFAQWQVGVSGGYGINSLEVNNTFDYGIRSSSRGGYNFSALCGYEFTDWFTLKAEMAYTQKNYEIHRTIEPLDNTYTEYTNGYIQLPLYASLSVGGKRLRGFTNVGAYAGYWAYGWVEGALSDAIYDGTPNTFSNSYEFNDAIDNRFEAGLLFGLGLIYNIDKHFAISAEGRLQYSLTDIQKNYMEDIVPKYFNSILFNIGVTYKF